MHTRTNICYITGRGGCIRNGLGNLLATLSDEVFGVSLSPELMARSPEAQVMVVSAALDRAEAEKAPVIANSYGAYLTLQAMVGRGTLRTKVLLLSPVLGVTVTKAALFKPPLTRRLKEAIEAGDCKAEWMEVHIGEEDEGYNPDRFNATINCLRPDISKVLQGEGHNLRRSQVTHIVRAFVDAGP